MPVAEMAAAVTGIRAALDITKAMVGLRDAEAFHNGSHLTLSDPFQVSG